jgi:hypothetical protein
MAILLEAQLSENQGLTPEGYLICKNVPVSRTGVQHYLGQELGLSNRMNERIPVYRLPEDVFEPESLQSLESKPITDDHPQQAVTVQNAGFLSMGHGRNVRNDGKNVIADLVLTNASLIDGVRDKRKYQISLGYTCQYIPYKDGYRQTNIRINHIAVVEVGRAGPKVSIKDRAPVSANNRRQKKMDKNQALATMFAAFAKDATPEEVAAMLPFVTDAAPAPKVEAKTDTDKGLIALLSGLMSKDAKPKAEAAPAAALTADAVSKIVADEVAKALKGVQAKPKATKDSDEKEVEKMLEDADGDEDDDKDKEAKDSDTDEKEKETEDEGSEETEEEKEAKDAAFRGVVKALQPLYKTMSTKDKKALTKDLASARKKPTKDAYAKILHAVQSHTKDAATTDAAPMGNAHAVSDRVMAARNPHYAKK